MVESAAAAQSQPDDGSMIKPKADAIPISEKPTDGSNRKVPKAVFIDDVEAWTDKYGEEPLF